MSSKRGRKRNDNLPPNRARDVQRAFRARRAAHLQALEQRVAELEEENENFRQALDLPPSNRPPLGKGPTGKDHPYHDGDRYRRHTVSPSGGSSAGSPVSYTSSPELSPTVLASSMSSRTMTMIEAGSSHWSDSLALNERQSTLSHGQQEQGPSVSQGQPIPILAPMPFKAPNSPSYHDRIPPPLHSPSNTFYPPYTPTSYSPTSERSIENNLGRRREHREEAQHNFYSFSQNYVTEPELHPDSPLHATNTNVCPPSYHNPHTTQREWNTSPSRVHNLRDQTIPDTRRFPRPPEQAQLQHSPQQPRGYTRQSDAMDVSAPRSSQQYHDARLQHFSSS